MAEKRSERRRLNILLGAHALLYAIGWAGALYLVSTLNIAYENFANSTHLIAAVLFWTPLLALHAGLHLYARRWMMPSDERTAYRQGYADALHQFADEAYDSRDRRDDDETIVNVPLKITGVKRKRSG